MSAFAAPAGDEPEPSGEPTRSPDDAPRSASPDVEELAAAYRHCEQVMVAAAKNFSYGIRLLPPAKRNALAAVYAYARRIDDIGDGELPAPEKLRRLRLARDDVARIGGPTHDPVLLALGDSAARLGIPTPAFLELIEGCELDVDGVRYDSFPQLLHYCRCVAGSIGRLSTGVFGAADPVAAAPLADALGVALQLTNILRDIREDLTNGRVYLPADELDAAGVVLRLDPAGNLVDDDGRLTRLIREQCSRAERWYADGLTLLPLLDRRSAACCAAMADIYHRLLRRIAADPSAVLHGRVSLPGWQKAYVAARSLAGARP